MAIGSERVKVMKIESSGSGGDESDNNPYGGPTPIDTSEDAIEVCGIYVHDASNSDQNVYVARGGNDLIFRDVNNTTPLTLSELLAGAGGITESSHKTLRQLIHFIDEGPAEGFTSGAYKEILPAGDLFPTSVTWWESSSKLKKIVAKLITRSGGGATNIKPTPIKWKIYDTDGSTVLWTISDAIVYSGIMESTRTRTITSGDA
jgi:hypothetical protein